MKFNKKDKNTIQELFNQVAKNYDKLNVIMTFGLQNFIKKTAVINALSKMQKNDIKILDLCCGTGDISILFKKLNKSANITAVDFSDEMLKIANNRTTEITFIKGDVTNLKKLNLKESSFDICFISFGLRNLPDIDKALDEFIPFIKKDGIISILDLGKPKGFMKLYFFFHYQILIPLFAKVFHGDFSPYKYFIDSEKHYPSPDIILEKLKEHRFTKTENKNFVFGVISQQIGVKNF